MSARRAALTGWEAQFIALAAIWGSSFLFIKVGVGDLSPVDVAFTRLTLGALTLLAILALQRVALPRDRRLWAHSALVGLVMNAAPFTLFAYGETRVSSVLAGIWNATTPLMTLLVALAMLPDERPTRQKTAGLLLGFVGVLVVLGPWRHLGGALIGNLACMAAAACYGLGGPYSRRFLADAPVSGTALAAVQMICASAMLGVVTVFVGGAPQHLGLDAVGSLLALGAGGTGVAFILFYGLIRRVGATTTSTVTYLIPLFSTALGVAVLGEGLSWHEPVGAVIVLVGVAVSQGRLGRRRREPAVVEGAAGG